MVRSLLVQSPETSLPFLGQSHTPTNRYRDKKQWGNPYHGASPMKSEPDNFVYIRKICPGFFMLPARDHSIFQSLTTYNEMNSVTSNSTNKASSLKFLLIMTLIFRA
uniref:Ovule protein n=1 Tax=Heterorhabditis bacteriophora TaxID=37862 RepID=A0A1I7XK72_HETBA